MAETNIGWTERTWNPVVGCAKVSPGCTHCYAETMARRLAGAARSLAAQGKEPGRRGAYLEVLDERGRWNGSVRLLPEALEDPLHWRPCVVFVNSMSDLFHEDVPDQFIDRVFAVMARCPAHTFQVLTKRADRMRRYLSMPGRQGRVNDAATLYEAQWPVWSRDDAGRLSGPVWPLPNVWMGTSVEDQRRADERIPLMLDTPATVRFLSCEPLLGPVDLWHPAFSECDRHGEPSGPRLNPDGRPAIGWVIVGGESGPNYRPCEVGWITAIVEQCREAGVACFVKQDSGPRPGMRGRLPADLWALKQFPPLPAPAAVVRGSG